MASMSYSLICESSALGHTVLVAPRHTRSSRTRGRARVSCLGRWILTLGPPGKSVILFLKIENRKGG